MTKEAKGKKGGASVKTFKKGELRDEYNERRELHDRAREELHKKLARLIKDLGGDINVRPIPLIQSDVKKFDAFYGKALKKRRLGQVSTAESCFVEIRDVVRARIICQTQDDRDRLVKMLDRDDVAGMFANRGAAEVHDESSNDRGYRAVHYDVTLDVQEGTGSTPVRCELQVCTALQFAWGLYTHGDVYKSGSASTLLRELMRDLSDALAVADRVAARLIAELERTGSAEKT